MDARRRADPRRPRVVTFLYLGDIEDPAGVGQGKSSRSPTVAVRLDRPAPAARRRQLKIRVNGQQYLWRYDYPGKSGELFNYYSLVVPTDTTVTLEHHVAGRHPLVVDPEARRQGRRRPGLQQPHLVQDLEAGR